MQPFNPARFAYELTPEQAAAMIAGSDTWQGIVLERLHEAYRRALVSAYGVPDDEVPPDWPIAIPGLVSQELARAIHAARKARNTWLLVQWCESSACAFELQRFAPGAIAVWLAREELPSACDFGQGVFDTYRPWLPPAPMAEPATEPPAPVQRAAAQDAAILGAIRGLGYDPQNLPKHAPGKPGVKAEIRDTLKASTLFVGATVFDKAWERLRKCEDIRDST